MYESNFLTVGEIIQTAASAGDDLAATLEAGAPDAATFVLNELDEIASCFSFYSLYQIDAHAKLTGAANYCRRTFGAETLGGETADALEYAAKSLAFIASSHAPGRQRN